MLFCDWQSFRISHLLYCDQGLFCLADIANIKLLTDLILMFDPPTLFSLCIKTTAAALVHGDELLQDIFDLPSCLFDALIENLSPLVLEKIHQLLGSSSTHKEGFATTDVSCGSKRGRQEVLNVIWKMLFRNRWPENTKIFWPFKWSPPEQFDGQCNVKNQIVDWRQIYWEKHLQDCLGEAFETAFLPSFCGSIVELKVSDKIMAIIGHNKEVNCACANLSYHYKRFGCYIRHLKLPSGLCVPETCELLRFCKLSHLIFTNVRTNNQVNGVCMLLKQQRESLLSLEFVHCRVHPAVLDKICHTVCHEGSQSHGIQHLHIKSSLVSESKLSSAPAGLLSFLSSGRLLKSICFRDTNMESDYAISIFDALLMSSSAVVTLEISDNNHAGGWLSKFDSMLSAFSSSTPNMSLKSLSSLSLRGNNLHKDNAEELHRILTYMPVLQSLDISNNPITDDGIRSLIPYFTYAVGKPYPLLDIKIADCNLSSAGISELLSSLLPIKEPLNTLSISGNDLGSSIASPLAMFLDASGLRVLDLEDVNLGALGFQQLEENMPKKMSLHSINISKNRGRIGAAHFISKILLHAPDLVSLNARGNVMPPESVAVIHTAIKRSHGKLELLDLNENPLLCQSSYISKLIEFSRHGKPIVLIPSSQTSSTPYDDDP